MRGWLRRVLCVLTAVTFLGGTIGLEFAFADEPCENLAEANTPPRDKHHHDDGTDAACVACPCCAVVPTLPEAPAALSPTFHVEYIVYIAKLPRFAGRSVAPDPSPPRPIA